MKDRVRDCYVVEVLTNRMLHIQSTIDDREKIEDIRIRQLNEVEVYYTSQEQNYRIMYKTTLVICTTIYMSQFLLSAFHFLYLRRIYPLCIYLLFLLIYVSFSFIDIGYFIATNTEISDDFVVNNLHSLRNKRFYAFIASFVTGIIVIIYYLWEMFHKEEYEIVASKEIVGWTLWINPKLFKTKLNESNCIEIPREIAILIFDHPVIKHNNDVKFYIKESDKGTLICKFLDGSVMYSEIILAIAIVF